MKPLSKLDGIKDLSSIQTKGDKGFIPWLADEDNIALLNDAVGIDITVEGQESKVGVLDVDIFASKTGTERYILI